MSPKIRTLQLLLHDISSFARVQPIRPSSARTLISLALLLLAGSTPQARAQRFFSLDDVRPGLRGIGKTVFSGNRIEEFQVEILGVLKDVGPKQTVILARLSGGPLAETGIQQGMSGSPVYIDGKLLGAVALGFPFSKEPIAGIQPIQTMIADSSIDAAPLNDPPPDRAAAQTNLWSLMSRTLPAHLPLDSSFNPAYSPPFGNLRPLSTPLSLAGFTSATLQTFAAEFRYLGFEPLQGLSGTGPYHEPSPPAHASTSATGTPASPGVLAPGAPGALIPGSMISVGLLSGDMNITADGTVTFVDGNRIYAFGHRFLNTGSTELPFARSEVVAVIPSLNSSFKLSTPREWIGAIVSDRATAISGEIGRSAHTIPLTVSVHSPQTGIHNYEFQVVNDRFLTPFITQTALYSVLDATERTLGSGTLSLEGRIEWAGDLPPLVIRDTFISDSAIVQQVSSDAVVPLGFVLGAGFHAVQTKHMTFHIEASEAKRQLHIAQAWTSSREVRPGESLRITALLQGENGIELTRSATYRVPIGSPAGALNFTVSDANTLNFPEFAGLNQSSLHSPESLIRAINSFRDNDSFYVRVWRQQPSFTITGPSSSGEIGDPPPSIALVLSDPSDSTTSNAALALTRGSDVAELSVPAVGYVVSGAKTLQVEVKEK